MISKKELQKAYDAVQTRNAALNRIQSEHISLITKLREEMKDLNARIDTQVEVWQNEKEISAERLNLFNEAEKTIVKMKVIQRGLQMESDRLLTDVRNEKVRSGAFMDIIQLMHSH